MLSQDEMERKLDALTAQNTALQRRISDLEEGTAGHVGIDYGAAQQLSPHPNQQIQTAEFGGGTVLLSENGIQLKAASDEDTKAMYFSESFSTTPGGPSGDISVSAIRNYVGSSGSNRLRMESFNANGDDCSLILNATFLPLPITSTMRAFSNDDGINTTIVVSSSTDGTNDQIVSISGKLRLWKETSDAAAAIDGDLWYRTDLFRFRARTNGITGNLGMEIQSAAADAVATGGTITTAGVSAARVAPTGAVTGVILAVGTTGGQMCQVVNESAAGNTVTFAVAATSNVANGVSSVIAGLRARSFVWNSSTSLWYPCI